MGVGMLVIIGIVMFIALIGMIVCSKKQKVNPNAQPVAIALLIVVVICGFMMMQKTGVFGGMQELSCLPRLKISTPLLWAMR